MHFGHGDILAAVMWGDPLALMLAAGLVGVFVVLAVLVWTRLGQARPITKCVFLSLLAHLLLLVYAYSTRVLFGPPGRWTGEAVIVRLHDAADDEEAATMVTNEPEPWEQDGSLDVPLSSAPPLEAIEPMPAATDVAVRDRVDEAATADRPPSEEPEALPDNEPPPLVEHSPKASPADSPPSDALANEAPADSLPKADPEQGLPDELIPSEVEMPQLTDLLPERQETSGAAAAPSAPATPPAEPSAQELFASAPAAEPRRLGDGEKVPEPLTARIAADRLKAAQPFGATPRSEAAVAAALDWLAKVQSADGRWDADAFGAGRETPQSRALSGGQDRSGTGREADTGITGLALLAFLGAGETHLSGEHRVAVQHGLEWLLGSQAASGSLAGRSELFAQMYCHGIATLALSEAYALSGDERLLPGLKRALQYTVSSQHAGGGWRYQPFDAGDMSQFGWQLMALRSAELGGIPIPAQTRSRMVRFLQSCSAGRSRGLASYRPGDRPSRSMTAEALVCRYFLHAENDAAAIDEGAAYVMEERPGVGTTNLYYWYYGTLAMFQRQGDDWPRWNSAMQHELLSRQRWDGEAAGSYDPDELWGGYGGRIYSTALATLCLEVYYRYLPVHENRPEARLTDRPWRKSGAGF